MKKTKDPFEIIRPNANPPDSPMRKPSELETVPIEDDGSFDEFDTPARDSNSLAVLESDLARVAAKLRDAVEKKAAKADADSFSFADLKHGIDKNEIRKAGEFVKRKFAEQMGFVLNGFNGTVSQETLCRRLTELGLFGSDADIALVGACTLLLNARIKALEPVLLKGQAIIPMFLSCIEEATVTFGVERREADAFQAIGMDHVITAYNCAIIALMNSETLRVLVREAPHPHPVINRRMRRWAQE